MIPGAIHTLAQTLTAAVAATGRPVATLFVCQAIVGAAVRSGYAEIHPYLSPAISYLAIATMAVFAFTEALFQHQTEFSEAVDDLYLHRVGAGASATASTLLLAAAGAPTGGLPDGELADLIRLVDGAAAHPVEVLLAVSAAIGISAVLGWVRAQVMEVVRDADLDGIYAWLESGGVLVVLLLMPLLPLVALGIVVAVSAVLVGVAITSRVGGWALDRRRRRPCTSCGKPARVEASICPSCGVELEIVRSLAPVDGEPARARGPVNA